MKRVLIIMILATGAVVLIGGGIILLTVKKSGNSSSDGRVTTTGTTNAPLPSVPRPEKGTTSVNASLAYRGVDFTIDTAGEFSYFHGTKAEADEKFVILFSKPLSPGASAASAWVTSEVKLVDGSGIENPVYEAEIIGPNSTFETGYFWFRVGKNQRNFRLVMQNDQEEATTVLGF